MINYLKANLPSSRDSHIDGKISRQIKEDNSKTIDRQLIEVVHTFVIFLCVGLEIFTKRPRVIYYIFHPFYSIKSMILQVMFSSTLLTITKLKIQLI
jgi:hypothetical protein